MNAFINAVKPSLVVIQVQVILEWFATDIAEYAASSLLFEVLQLYMPLGIVLPRNLLMANETQEGTVGQFFKVSLLFSRSTFKSHG